jgi:hypothetical protein
MALQALKNNRTLIKWQQKKRRQQRRSQQRKQSAHNCSCFIKTSPIGEVFIFFTGLTYSASFFVETADFFVSVRKSTLPQKSLFRLESHPST